MQQSRLDAGGFTVAGQRRGSNQDAWTIFSSEVAPEWMVCAVADGVGGGPAGGLASASALEAIEGELRASNLADPADALLQATADANATIWNEAHRYPSNEGMASTIVCAVIGPEHAVVANVGDSGAIL